MLLILGGNPVYNAPADFDFADSLKKPSWRFTWACTATRPRPVRLACSGVAFPRRLERCARLRRHGQHSAAAHRAAVRFPLIRQRARCGSAIPPRRTYDIVRAYWTEQQKGKDFEPWWRKSVRDGLVANSALPQIAPTLATTWSPAQPQLGNQPAAWNWSFARIRTSMMALTPTTTGCRSCRVP